MSATTKTDASLKRLRSLLALAKSQNQHEAANAKTRANELLQRYSISEKDLVEKTTEIAPLHPGMDGHQRDELARVISRSRGVTAKIDQQIIFTGYPEAAKDARELFCALTRIVETNCELPGPALALGRQGYQTESDRFLWRTCFWLGFVEAVHRQLDPEHASIPRQALATILKNTQAPPIIEKALRAFENLRDRLQNSPYDAQASAEQFKSAAHDSGFNLGMQNHIPSYKGKK